MSTLYWLFDGIYGIFLAVCIGLSLHIILPGGPEHL